MNGKQKGNSFELGWLNRQLEKAHIGVMVGHSRCFYGNHPGFLESHPYPTSWEDAEALLNVLSSQFKSWTGRSIEDHINARPPTEQA